MYSSLTDQEEQQVTCTIFQNALNALDCAKPIEYTWCIGGKKKEERERGLQMEESCAEEEERLQAAF